MTLDNNGGENGISWHDVAHRFAKGNPGRQPGSKNKLRDEIKTFLRDNWKDFPSWFAELRPREKIETMISLMPYAVSRLQSIAMTDNEGNTPSRSRIDFTKLSEATLREILQHTTIEQNENS